MVFMLPFCLLDFWASAGIELIKLPLSSRALIFIGTCRYSGPVGSFRRQMIPPLELCR